VEVADGNHRLTHGVVNFYLVVQDGGQVTPDAGGADRSRRAMDGRHR
jgi:hypothetical protein